MFNRIFTKINPNIFFIPGLFGAPVGAVAGGYHAFKNSGNKNLFEDISVFTMCVATGSVVGGIVGTIWPISFTTFVLVNIPFRKVGDL